MRTVGQKAVAVYVFRRKECILSIWREISTLRVCKRAVTLNAEKELNEMVWMRWALLVHRTRVCAMSLVYSAKQLRKKLMHAWRTRARARTDLRKIQAERVVRYARKYARSVYAWWAVYACGRVRDRCFCVRTRTEKRGKILACAHKEWAKMARENAPVREGGKTARAKRIVRALTLFIRVLRGIVLDKRHGRGVVEAFRAMCVEVRRRGAFVAWAEYVGWRKDVMEKGVALAVQVWFLLCICVCMYIFACVRMYSCECWKLSVRAYVHTYMHA